MSVNRSVKKIFKVTIQKFGKLTNAVVRIGKFTVFAGRNNTGKTFASKLLYSIFSAVDASHLAVIFGLHLDSLKNLAQWLKEEKLQVEGLANLINAVEELRDIFRDALDKGGDKISALESVVPSMTAILSRMDSAYTQMRPQLEKLRDAKPAGGIDLHIDALLRMKDSGPLQYVVEGLSQQIIQNITENFQVRDLSRLGGSDSLFITANRESFGGFNVSENESGSVDISLENARAMKQYSRALYLESPVLWRLKNALESADRLYPRQVPDVPKYFHDMAQAIKREYTGGIGLSDVSESIADTIGGRVVVDATTGNLLFNERDGGEHPLHLAAMGVANFGMLGLLIERNLLDDNTILFVDEPEAHLHPAWQVAMAKVLFTLAERGVSIIMATHSADILKWLEVKLKESPEAEEKIALNHFRKDGTVEDNGKSFAEKLDDIQEDLADPYYHLFYEGLS